MEHALMSTIAQFMDNSRTLSTNRVIALSTSLAPINPSYGFTGRL